VTAIFPYVVIFSLIIRGMTLPGAMKGIRFYIFEINMDKLMSLETWMGNK
jgi:SNF family Na+-dependent transporter